jgi:uncharacterized protein (TIGR02145 family)
MKTNFIFRVILFVLISLLLLTTCRKDKEVINQITKKEENLIKLETKLLPDQLIDLFKSELSSKQSSSDYNIFLDSLTLASEKLYNVLVQQNELQHFKNHLNFILNELSSRKSGKGLIFNDCDLAEMGLGYAEGVSVSANANAGIALVILAELSSKKNVGIKVVYDFVNLERQYYLFSACSQDPGFNWGIGLGAALKAGLGFTGFVELITGLKTKPTGINQLAGPSVQTTYSLNVDIGAIFEFPLDKISYAPWKKGNGDCINGNILSECPEFFGQNFSGIKGYTIGVGGGLSLGDALMVSLTKSEIGICSEQMLSKITLKDFGKSKYGRILASTNMAGELLNPFANGGIIVSQGNLVAAAAVVTLYGLGDPAKCQSMNLPPSNLRYISPSNNEKIISARPKLEWACSDPENNELTYELFLGKSNNPPLFSIYLKNPVFQIETPLEGGVEYFWKVIAYDDQGNSTTGPIWRFTVGGPPSAAFSYSPKPATVGQSVQFTNLSSNDATSWEWEFGDNSKSTVKNPSHTYVTAVTFTVGLTSYNSFGWSAAAGNIIVNPAVTPTIPTVTTTVISGITQTTASSGGNVTSIGSSDVIVRGVCWSTASNPTTTDNVTTDGAGIGSFTSSITGLTAGTIYHVRAYAINSAGTAYGVDRSFTTLVTPLIPAVTTTAISGITQTTATSGGNVTSIGSSDVIVRGVCWSTASNPTTTDNVTTDGAGIGSFTSSMTGLTAGTTYHVRAYAINSAGTAYGVDRSFTTLVTPTIPAVTTTAISGITQTTAISGGNVTSIGSSDVIVRGVCWSTASNPTTTDNVTTDGAGIGSFTSSITGLTAGTTYHVRAYARNSTGIAYGSDVSFTSLIDFTGTINDVDGNVYNTMTIGSQVWMVENLKATKYNNGIAIPNVTATSAWSILSTPSYCWYKNDVNYKNSYGALYNFYAINTGKLCPIGWHVNSDAEWTQLETYLGGSTIAVGKLKETGLTHWASPNTGATNESGFNGLPGGRRYRDGTFDYMTFYGFWWTSTTLGTNDAWERHLSYDKPSAFSFDSRLENGYSVRCIKD